MKISPCSGQVIAQVFVCEGSLRQPATRCLVGEICILPKCPYSIRPACSWSPMNKLPAVVFAPRIDSRVRARSRLARPPAKVHRRYPVDVGASGQGASPRNAYSSRSDCIRSRARREPKGSSSRLAKSPAWLGIGARRVRATRPRYVRVVVLFDPWHRSDRAVCRDREVDHAPSRIRRRPITDFEREVCAKVERERFPKIRAEAKAGAVLAVLAARGLAITADQQSRLLACTDAAKLDRLPCRPQMGCWP